MRIAALALFLSWLHMPLGYGQTDDESSASEADAAAEPAADEADSQPASTPIAEQEKTAESAPESGGASDSGKGLLGDFRIGPTIQVPGIPHPMNYGLDVTYGKSWSFGFATGKYTVTALEPAEIQIANWDLRARWHPFAGSFFVGAAWGQQTLFGQASQDVEFKVNGVEVTVPTTIQIEIETSYLTPHIGWFAVWDSGFTAGFEVGAQVPLSSKTEMDVAFENVAASQEAAVKASDKYKDLEKKVDDAGKMIGEQVVPYLTLLRLGWLF